MQYHPVSESNHEHLYIPGGGDRCDEFEDKFLEIMRSEEDKFFVIQKDSIVIEETEEEERKEREAIKVKGPRNLDVWITVFPFGCDMYIGYTLVPMKGKRVDEIENQDSEAFLNYIQKRIDATLEALNIG